MRHAMILLAALVSGCAAAETPVEGQPAPGANPTEERREGKIENIDVDALQSQLDGGEVAVLVDVRTPEEFADGHVPGAVNIPLQDIGSRQGELESYRDKEVHLICRSGGRSARAASMLSASGFDTVNVEGGTLAWQAAGKAVE